jgi:hypothetical protein
MLPLEYGIETKPRWDRLGSDQRVGDGLELKGEIDLDLAVEAADAEAEHSFRRVVMLVAAVGAEVRRLHGPSIGDLNATWVARPVPFLGT